MFTNFSSERQRKQEEEKHRLEEERKSKEGEPKKGKKSSSVPQTLQSAPSHPIALPPDSIRSGMKFKN